MSEVVLKQTLLFRFFSLKIVGKMLHPWKLTCPLKINGWFRCIPYWNSPFLVFRGVPIWQVWLDLLTPPSSTNTHCGGSKSIRAISPTNPSPRKVKCAEKGRGSTPFFFRHWPGPTWKIGKSIIMGISTLSKVLHRYTIGIWPSLFKSHL